MPTPEDSRPRDEAVSAAVAAASVATGSTIVTLIVARAAVAAPIVVRDRG
nr:hypothetical protein [uncultured Actinoplanes sp.]